MKKYLSTKSPLFFASLYGLFGAIWILTTDRLLAIFIPNVEQLTILQTAKGWVFVAVSTLLIYIFLQTSQKLHNEAQETLAEKEKEQQVLFQNNPLPMWVYDIETLAILTVNHAALEQYGYSQTEFLNMTIKDIRPQNDISRLLEDVVSTKEPLNKAGEWQHKRADGTIFPVDIISHTLVYNDRNARLVVARDTTERHKSEKEREQLLERLREQTDQIVHIMQSVPEGIILLDRHDRILMANNHAQDQLAILSNEQIGDVLTHLGGVSLQELQTSPVLDMGHEIISPNDRIFVVATRPIETSTIMDGWVLIIREVTKERFVQQQLQQQEKLAAIGQLASGIAHDFNNIIAVIILYTQLIQKRERLEPKSTERLTIIAQQATRASELIQQILDFSRQSIMERRPIDLLPLLKEQVKLLKRMLPENITIHIQYNQPDDFVVEADLTRMQQTILNLAVNARDAMRNGGEILFKLSHLAVSSVKETPLPNMATGHWVQLVIQDSGTGISQDTLSRVFDPFFTTKGPNKGTGLGLAQVHGIISQHGGHITVTSEVGKGTSFVIYLPAFATATKLEHRGLNTAVPKGNGELILVVEDQEPLRQALIENLTLLEYQILVADNGVEALKLLEDAQEEVALIISDVVMPHMGGVALLQNIHQRGWQIPILLMSGHWQLDMDTEHLRSQGLVEILSKPLWPDTLAQSIATALGKGL